MKRANVHQGDIKVTADEGHRFPFSVTFVDGNDDMSLTEQEARDLHACLDAALIQWDGDTMITLRIGILGWIDEQRAALDTAATIAARMVREAAEADRAGWERCARWARTVEDARSLDSYEPPGSEPTG